MITQSVSSGRSDVAGTSGRAKASAAKPLKVDLAQNDLVIVIAQRAGAVAAALGSKSKLAELLSVSPSQPTRWIQGAEHPSPENARVIVDLDHVVARAGLLWTPPVVSAWLTGGNAFLDGARPIDVLKATGSTPVIEALDQELAGGYA